MFKTETRYPIVEGVPVLLVSEAEQTYCGGPLIRRVQTLTPSHRTAASDWLCASVDEKLDFSAKFRELPCLCEGVFDSYSGDGFSCVQIFRQNPVGAAL